MPYRQLESYVYPVPNRGACSQKNVGVENFYNTPEVVMAKLSCFKNFVVNAICQVCWRLLCGFPVYRKADERSHIQ